MAGRKKGIIDPWRQRPKAPSPTTYEEKKQAVQDRLRTPDEAAETTVQYHGHRTYLSVTVPTSANQRIAGLDALIQVLRPRAGKPPFQFLRAGDPQLPGFVRIAGSEHALWAQAVDPQAAVDLIAFALRHSFDRKLTTELTAHKINAVLKI